MIMNNLTSSLGSSPFSFPSPVIDIVCKIEFFQLSNSWKKYRVIVYQYQTQTLTEGRMNKDDQRKDVLEIHICGILLSCIDALVFSLCCFVVSFGSLLILEHMINDMNMQLERDTASREDQVQEQQHEQPLFSILVFSL